MLAGARVPVMLVLLDDEHAAARPAIAVRILGRQRVDRGPATEESDLASLVKLLGAELREARNAGGSGQRGTLAVVEPRQWAVMDRDGMGGSASWTATNGRPCLSGEPIPEARSVSCAAGQRPGGCPGVSPDIGRLSRGGPSAARCS